uniref:Uncharacterized protein n=1 Tax=Panagrolaimus sp. ES5 TaxID=591445 RepID=A0AC34FAI3_9BILA
MFFSRLTKLYENKKQFLGFISTDFNGKNFTFVALDSNTNSIVGSKSFENVNTKELLDTIPTLEQLFKGIVIDLFQLDLHTTPYNVSFKFCQDLRKALNERHIPNYFVSEEYYLFTSLLIASKIDLEFGDSVIMILPHKSPTPKALRKTFELTIGEFKFTADGYQLISYNEELSLNLKAKPELLYEKICETITTRFCQNVIVASSNFKKVPFKKIFKSSNLFVSNEQIESYRKLFMIEKCKWLMDKSYIKNHIIQVFDRNLHIFGYFGSAKNVMDILKIDVNEALPISRSFNIAKSVPQLHMMFSSRKAIFGNHKEIPANCHRLRVTVNIDEENFDKITLYQLCIENFDTLPSKLNELLPSKIPFIAFFDNSSVIAIYDEATEGYDFLKEWNGMYGINCFISFDQKKPKFGNDAMEVILTKNTFVVFDLLKIMSMPSDDIRIDKTWGFKFTKDCNNPVLLQFDNFDGTIKEASPEFLMALFLRQHLKAIQESNNDDREKPKEIAFWIQKQKFNDEEYTRIQEGIAKACQLLKIDCCFVGIEL